MTRCRLKINHMPSYQHYYYIDVIWNFEPFLGVLQHIGKKWQSGRICKAKSDTISTSLCISNANSLYLTMSLATYRKYHRKIKDRISTSRSCFSRVTNFSKKRNNSSHWFFDFKIYGRKEDCRDDVVLHHYLWCFFLFQMTIVCL